MFARGRPDPIPDLGDVLGVIATTYDLSPDFVETDFLPNLFGTTAWDDRTWVGGQGHPGTLETSLIRDCHTIWDKLSHVEAP